MHTPLDLPEQLHNIVEIYPPVPIKVKRTDRFIRRNPRHLVEMSTTSLKSLRPLAFRSS